MKKDLIFAPILILLGILLGLLKVTGITAHIVISVIGLVVLIVYSVLTKKEWKLPVLDIIMRVFYGIALITGVLLMNIHGVLAINIIHKLSAILFILLMISLFIHKLVISKK